MIKLLLFLKTACESVFDAVFFIWVFLYLLKGFALIEAVPFFISIVLIVIAVIYTVTRISLKFIR